MLEDILFMSHDDIKSFFITLSQGRLINAYSAINQLGNRAVPLNRFQVVLTGGTTTGAGSSYSQVQPKTWLHTGGAWTRKADMRHQGRCPGQGTHEHSNPERNPMRCHFLQRDINDIQYIFR